ncbi:hypothetical protein [Paludibaculum fermentans]|uniref:hypothetical protein n=1 Tax=Paludibaculum fermentans TaxID=1473598 RepID=UPI003EBC3DFB
MNSVVELFARFLLFFEYFLTAGFRMACALGCYVVLLWLFLTEYYLAARFPWWQGWWEYAFLVPAFGLPAVLSAYGVCRLERIRPPMSPMAFDERDPAKMAVPVAAWVSMLREAARNRRGLLLGSFLRWQARLLVRYGAGVGPLPRPQLPRVWRRTFRHALALAWFPTLLVYLCSPFSSPPMETLAAILADRPAGVERMKVGRVDAKIGLIEEDLLAKGDENEWYIQSPAKFPLGWLTTFPADFPRVYRRLQALSLGEVSGCVVAPDPRVEPGLVTLKPVRAGTATIDFWRSAEGSLDLQMELTLFRRDSVTVVAKAFVH